MEFRKPWQSSSDFLKDPETIAPRRCKMKFGIRYLDLALGGIFPGDVILLGARTGVGKTEIVSTIAMNAAKAGMNVNMICLEAEEREIERRIYYKALAKSIYESPEKRSLLKGRTLTYPRWSCGEFEDIANVIQIPEELSRFFTTYRENIDFDIEKITNHLCSSMTAMDLVILDHIHYIDFDSDKENSEMKAVIKMIRETALRKKVPIVVVGHLRKAQSRFESLVPTIDEFHGSSDLSKIATQAILLAPCYDPEIQESTETTFPTFMTVAKNRRDGSVTRSAAVLTFDITTNSYEPVFRLGLIKKNTFLDFDKNQTPAWAKGWQ